VPLGSHWLSGPGPASVAGLVFVGVLALLAGLVWLSVRLSQLMTAQATAVPATAPVPAKAPVSAKAPAPARAKARAGGAQRVATKTAPDATAQAPPVPGGALVKVLPYLTVVIAAFAPLAAGIYLIVSTGWSLVERRLYMRSATAPAAPPQP
jgi:YidC/Oxa1 family membrane protein insertase